MSTNSSEPLDPQAAAALQLLIVSVRDLQIVNYIEVSANAWLFYDMALTFGRELRFIWKTEWSFVKILYILSRYYGPAYLVVTTAVSLTPASKLSIDFCRHYYWYFCVGGDVVFTTLVNVILVLRLCALFSFHRLITAALIGFLAAEFGSELWVSIKIAQEISVIASVAPPGVPITGCIAVAPRRGFQYASWIPCLALAALFFVMTIFQAHRTLHIAMRNENNGLPTGNSNLKSSFRTYFSALSLSKLVFIIVRDGAVYYLCITAILLVSTVVTQTVAGPFNPISLPWLIAIYSFAGTRLILNLREAAVQRNATATWKETVEMETFRAREGETLHFNPGGTSNSDGNEEY